MNDPIAKMAGSGESHSGSLVRGSIGFFGGLLLCGAALLAQAALLQAIGNSNKKTN
jgi:hypothetical protein